MSVEPDLDFTNKPEGASLPGRALNGSAADPDAPVPFVFGKRIAQGGMGAILEAQDCKIGRTIAVKLMLSELNVDEDQKQRFINEAAVLGRLEHPNIVPIHDLGRTSAGDLYYTMKLVKGRTLKDILHAIRDGDAEAAAHYTLDRLLTIFRKVCDAMAFAHANGIIHRDLKPENIMVGEFGEVLVMDWGLAKTLASSRSGDFQSPSGSEPRSGKNEAPSSAADAVDASTAIGSRHSLESSTNFGMTMEGDVLGTPQYMSPEQADGRIADMDARSDIFSLGGILYTILTLRPPVEGKGLREVLENVSSANITAPTTFGATITGKGKPGANGEVLEAKKIKPLPHVPAGRVPPALSAVTMKALTLDKAKRYQHIAAFSADIEKYQGGFATSAEKAGLMNQLSLLIKRNKGIFTTAATAWLLITGLAVWFVFNLRAKEQRAIAGEEAAIVEKESSRRAAATANLNVADAALREGDSAAMLAALHAVPEDLRDSTWSYLLAQADTSIARIRTSAEGILGVAPHPQRPGVFAVGDSDGKITLLMVRTGARLLQFTAGFTQEVNQRSYRLAFSPDGERIAVGRANQVGGIVIHSARDGKKLAEWDAPLARTLAFSPGGRLLLQQSGEVVRDTSVIVWDGSSGQQLWRHEKVSYASGAFTPDGQVLTFGDGQLRLVEAATGKLVRPFPSQNLGIFNGCTALAVGSAGLIAIADLQRAVNVVNWQTGRVITRFEHQVSGDLKIEHLAWAPDGEQLVTVIKSLDERHVLRLWDARKAFVLRSLLGGSGALSGLGLHPLSGEVLVSGRASRAWDLTGQMPKWRLPGSGSSRIVFWGSDDVVIASTTGDSLAVVQKLLPGGGASELWRPAKGRVTHPSVSADGRWAAVRGEPAAARLPLTVLRRDGERIEPAALIPPSTDVNLTALSPKGERLLGFRSGSGEVECFSTASGQPLWKLPRGDIKSFNAFGWLSEERIVGLVTAKASRQTAGSKEQVVVCDAASGKILQTARHDTPMDTLAIESGGRRFAEAGADKKVRVRDVATLAVQQEFRAHDGAITALAWHPTRPILATASTDLVIRLWDLDTGRLLQELRGPRVAANQLAFSPSGRRLGCAANNQQTHIWEPESLQD